MFYIPFAYSMKDNIAKTNAETDHRSLLSIINMDIKKANSSLNKSIIRDEQQKIYAYVDHNKLPSKFCHEVIDGNIFKKSHKSWIRH